MSYDTETTLTVQENLSNAMCEHHYEQCQSCADDCLINRLLCKYIERYDPDFSKALTSAENDKEVYLLLLLKLCELAPTAANKEELQDFKDFCICYPEETP